MYIGTDTECQEAIHNIKLVHHTYYAWSCFFYSLANHQLHYLDTFCRLTVSINLLCLRYRFNFSFTVTIHMLTHLLLDNLFNKFRYHQKVPSVAPFLEIKAEYGIAAPKEPELNFELDPRWKDAYVGFDTSKVVENILSNSVS